MSFSMYQASIPVFIHMMRAMGGVLEKGRASAVSRDIEPTVLIEARLAPDMHKLSRQVQIASDIVKNGGARLAGVQAPSFPDTETSFEALQERLTKTIDFLQPITAEQMEVSEARQITLKLPNREMTFDGAAYLTGFVLPNLYFHATATYTILRHIGVPLGKADFMGMDA